MKRFVAILAASAALAGAGAALAPVAFADPSDNASCVARFIGAIGVSPGAIQSQATHNGDHIAQFGQGVSQLAQAPDCPF